MFDTMKVAKQIKDSRIKKNMTQMQLADAMGVSYQAVSNWERGNSMPDISKLEELCAALDIPVAQLLGIETPETAAVEKVMQKEALTVEEITDIAPILPPAVIREQAKSKKSGCRIGDLILVAPFLDEDALEELLEEAEYDTLADLLPIVPFVDEDVLDKLVRRALALDQAGILSLAPFLDEDTLDWVVRNYAGEMDSGFMVSLAPFLDEDTVDALVETQLRLGNVNALAGIYPFMEDDTLRKVLKVLISRGDLKGAKKVSEFL